jgi:hypothetical protein
MELHAIGIDPGKTVFHLVGLDSSGNVMVRKGCSHVQLLKYTANLRVQRIGMEACSGSHFLARALHDGTLAPLAPTMFVAIPGALDACHWRRHGQTLSRQ